MATVTRAPTSDEAVSGTWSGSVGSRYTLVDDYPDTAPTDLLQGGTATSVITFGFSAFSVPADSTAISVQVIYYDKEPSNGSNNCGGRLKVGGSYFNAATHNPSTTLTSRSDNWATNPKSAAAWTVDDVNGIGSNALQAFGINSTDSNPAFQVSSIAVQITYTPPALGDLSKTLGAATSSATGAVEVSGTESTTLGSVAISSAGTVADAEISGVLSQTLAAVTSSAAGTVDIAGVSTSTLGLVVSSAAGTVDVVGVFAKTLASVTSSAAGVVDIAGVSASTLGSVVSSAAGVVDILGSVAKALQEVSISSAGTAGSGVYISTCHTPVRIGMRIGIR